MKLFANTRARRNTAFVVLLVWLFALASGVANACLLEARGTHSHVAAAGSSGTEHAPAVSPGHAGAVAGHDDGSRGAKAACEKVCSEGSQSLVTPDLRVVQVDFGPVPFVAVLWTPAAPVVLASGPMDDIQPIRGGPPIRVRFSRLAL